MKKPTLLYVSPVIPMFTGTGIAMRSALHIRELSRLFTITLGILLDGQSEIEAEAEIQPELRALCTEILISSKSHWQTRFIEVMPIARLRALLTTVLRVPPARQRSRAAADLARILSSRSFDVVHCFRLITAPLVFFLKCKGVIFQRSILDMDDYESRTKTRYAQTLLRRQGWLHSLAGHLEAAAWRRLEQRVIGDFDDIFVCSEMDRLLLSERFSHSTVTVIPNVIEAPAAPSHETSALFTFLFVGTLGYPPNRDAVFFFCEEILPLLRRKAQIPFRFQVVGARADQTLKNLHNGHDIEIIGAVPDVAAYYGGASVVIVPLRAGGGTRIKILEAQSHELPVVSTTVGAEGLDVCPGRDILIADSPEDFAGQCFNLMQDSKLRAQIAAAGRSLFEGNYTVAHLSARLKAVHGRVALQETASHGFRVA